MTEQSNTVEALSFEEALAELEQIVGRLESGQGSLDDAIKAYERGSDLKKHCQKKLDEARMKVEKIRLPEGGGAVETSEFES
ncbi:MAG: exodeoxyribonuclease VII small subunit [Proteobacteria bacterium]|nr:exodeoxyribonuclease VII small subunit [Pseudomonadota bacterium]